MTGQHDHAVHVNAGVRDGDVVTALRIQRDRISQLRGKGLRPCPAGNDQSLGRDRAAIFQDHVTALVIGLQAADLTNLELDTLR